MPVLCVWIPAFRLAVATRQRPLAPGVPALVADRRDRGRVVDCSLDAGGLGIRPGMTLLQAIAIALDAEILIDEPAEDARVWSEVLDALDAASPLVEDAGLGLAFLEMHGIDGGETAWLAAAREALAPFALPVRLGLGPSPFVARAAAGIADGTVVAGDPAAFVAPLPLALLELDPLVAERLRILGITTLGDLAALPHGPFVRRFGAEAATWHRRARGIDDRPLRPRARAVRIERALYGDGEATSEEQVLFALRTLVARVVDDLAAAGRRAGRLVLRLALEDGDTRELSVGVAQATAVPATLFDLLRARLEGLTLPCAVVGLELVAERLETGGVALSLFAASDPDPDAVGVALARLDAIVGGGGAQRARVVDAARIEHRYSFEPFDLEALRTKGAPPPPPPPLPATATLQLRPVHPHPIDVTLAGGVPSFVGSPPQAVIDCAGPWRIDDGWWFSATATGTRTTRDEYDVLLDDGSLLRISTSAGTWTVTAIYD